MNWKLIWAVLLCFPTLVLGGTLYTLMIEAWAFPELRDRVLYAAIGFGVWCCIFLFHRMHRLYIFAHEFVHVLFASLCGVKAKNMKVGARSGQVEVAEGNWLIILSPYFFPLYAAVFLVLFSAAAIVIDFGPWRKLALATFGVLWGFHYTFTLHALFQSQEDVRHEGWFFSLVIILFGNLLFLSIALIFLLPVDIREFFHTIAQVLKNWIYWQ